MPRVFPILAAVLAASALPGCATVIHGHQSTGGGAATTTISSSVSGSVKASGARASFSSGPAVAPNAPGGTLVLGRGASAVLFAGLALMDIVHYFSAPANAPVRPLPGPRESIADTCSCYRKPVNSDQ